MFGTIEDLLVTDDFDGEFRSCPLMESTDNTSPSGVEEAPDATFLDLFPVVKESLDGVDNEPINWTAICSQLDADDSMCPGNTSKAWGSAASGAPPCSANVLQDLMASQFERAQQDLGVHLATAMRLLEGWLNHQPVGDVDTQQSVEILEVMSADAAQGQTSRSISEASHVSQKEPTATSLSISIEEAPPSEGCPSHRSQPSPRSHQEQENSPRNKTTTETPKGEKVASNLGGIPESRNPVSSTEEKVTERPQKPVQEEVIKAPQDDAPPIAVARGSCHSSKEYSLEPSRIRSDKSDRHDSQQLKKGASRVGRIQSISRSHSVRRPSFENRHFEVLPIWRKEYRPLAARLGKFGSQKMYGDIHNVLAGSASGAYQPPTVSRPSWCGKRILHPNTMKRAMWDITSLLFVTYDLVVIPLQTLEPPENFFNELMTWVTRFFWSLDIIASFSTGFMKSDGSVETRPSKIARKYLKGWFWLDVIIVGADWAEEILAQASVVSYARTFKASRAFRIIRMVRLLRLVRMRDVFKAFIERFMAESLIIVAGMVRLLLAMVLTAHIIACIWYGIGSRDHNPSWVRKFNYERTSLSYRYTSSFYWSLLLFSGGTDEVVPQNTVERVYAIAVFLIAFVTAAVFVSSLTSSMTQLHMLASHHSQNLSVLRRYLHHHGVSQSLAMRVLRNAQHAVSEQKRLMPEDSVELLRLVSDPLRVELHYELYSPVLCVHQFFHHYVEECPQVVRKICHTAVSLLLVSRGDVLFSPGEIPAEPKMYIICSGRLLYRHVNGIEKKLQQGQWISEATLWTPWMHRGHLVAATECRLCILDAKKFQDIVGEFDHTDLDFSPKQYAERFVEELNEVNNGHQVSDCPSETKDKATHQFFKNLAQRRRERHEQQRHEQQRHETSPSHAANADSSTLDPGPKFYEPQPPSPSSAPRRTSVLMKALRQSGNVPEFSFNKIQRNGAHDSSGRSEHPPGQSASMVSMQDGVDVVGDLIVSSKNSLDSEDITKSGFQRRGRKNSRLFTTPLPGLPGAVTSDG